MKLENIFRVGIPRVLSLAWAQITLAFICGTALTYYFETTEPKILHHVGIGLIVAAVVTTFWQFREFEDFFTRFSRQILVEDAYLEKLAVPALTSLRARAGHAILKTYVTNPAYEREALGDWIDELLYKTLLPGQGAGSGMYRDRYEEDICVEHMTLRDALTERKIAMENIPAAKLDTMILKVRTITTYRVISPRLDDQQYTSYPVNFSGNGADMDHFPMNERLSVRVGSNASTAVPLDLQLKNEPMGGFTYVAKPALLSFDGETGLCPVWMETVEYRDLRHEPYVLGTMGLLTKTLSVHVSRVGSGPPLTFEGNVIATGTKQEPVRGPNSFTLRFDGWLFEDHGYYVWWWNK